MGGRSNDTQNTSSNTSYDNRQVNDAGGGIIGAGNSQTTNNSSSWNWDASNRSSTTWTDSGNKSQNWSNTDSSNRSQTWTDSGDKSQNWSSTDSSDRSQTWTDSGDKSQHWTQTTTNNSVDGGAIKGMTDVALAQSSLTEKLAKIAQGGADTVVNAAIKSQQIAMDANGRAQDSAFDFAKSNSAQAFKSSSEALGFARDGMSGFADLTRQLVGAAQRQADQAAGTAQAAYSSAASQANGNKTLTIAALAAVGVVAAAVVFKKG